MKELPQITDKTIKMPQLINFSLTIIDFGEVPDLEPNNGGFLTIFA
jgi:hypothetical protein